MLDFILPVLARVLVPMFILGMAGSALVVIITLAEDFSDFLSDSGNEAASHDGLN